MLSALSYQLKRRKKDEESKKYGCCADSGFDTLGIWILAGTAQCERGSKVKKTQNGQINSDSGSRKESETESKKETGKSRR